MRTTIELPDDLRRQLLQEAGRTGLRGFSHIVEEALRQYFARGLAGHDRRAVEVAELFGIEDPADERNALEDGSTRHGWRTGRDLAAENPEQ